MRADYNDKPRVGADIIRPYKKICKTLIIKEHHETTLS